MFRILVVEDVMPVLTTLRERISEQVVGSIIDTAETVLEAKGLIDRMLALGAQYDCAVLDFRLPTGDGGEYVDSSLCLLLRRTMKNVGVIHITSAAQASRQILEHIRLHHSDPSMRACALVDKADIDFYSRTCEEVRKFLYSGYIDQQLEGLFSAHSAESILSATTELQRFERDAVRMWFDLSDLTRDRIHQRFMVNDEVTPVAIELR